MAFRHCNVCNLDHDEDGEIHKSSEKHRFNFQLYQYKEYRKGLVKDRDGIQVIIKPKQTNGFRYDYTQKLKKGKHTLKITPEALLRHGNVLEFECMIKNIRKKDSVILTGCDRLYPYQLWKRIDKGNNLDDGRLIEMLAGAIYTDLSFRFYMKNIAVGSYKIPIFFNFQTVDEYPVTITIIRSLVVCVEDVIEAEVQVTSPFTNNEWDEDIEVYPPTKRTNYLNSYPIPEDLHLLLKMGLKDNGKLDATMFDLLQLQLEKIRPDYPTEDNYQDIWHLLLWMEEISQALMLNKYNMENITKKFTGNLLEIVVPGLAEKRPSVIVGDMIDIMIQGDHTAYRGIIKRVNDKTVEVESLHEHLLMYIKQNPSMELDVRFTLNRLVYERQHQAVDQVVNTGIVSALFPDLSLSRKNYGDLGRITKFFNKTIADNLEQKTAVTNIVNGTSGSSPYIVFGPPGTGKTVTIVEAILQIKERTQKNILVCAPANAACDMLAEKLMEHCSRKELIRVISRSVDVQNINPRIMKYTNVMHGEIVQLISEELGKYRIVVTTLMLIGRHMRKYHPDVVFVDEAAQPREPEALCALAMIERNQQIVLAGDPNQLGPSTASRRAGELGLGTSLLERLMALELYQSGGPNFITMLKLNFRSHRTILAIPNKLFYGNQLLAVSDESNTDPLARTFIFEKIQGMYGTPYGKAHVRGQPIEFCSIMSQESREGRSPSYFNTKELQMVIKYVQALTKIRFNNGHDNVEQKQIGIVTPYIRQVYKIREELRKNHFDNVEVGTTETFQGREKRVIIISTVRAKHDLLAYDKKYNLGFVSNEKRFNVALTRAKSKLIVIGCPHVLATDRNWLQFINYCEELDAFCGAPFAKRTNDVKNYVINKLSGVKPNH